MRKSWIPLYLFSLLCPVSWTSYGKNQRKFQQRQGAKVQRGRAVQTEVGRRDLRGTPASDILLRFPQRPILFCMKVYISSNQTGIFSFATLAIEKLAYIIIRCVVFLQGAHMRPVLHWKRQLSSPSQWKMRMKLISGTSENVLIGTRLLGHELHVAVVYRQDCHLYIFLSPIWLLQCLLLPSR